MKIGEYLNNYLIANKLSQREFAKHCGLSNGYISMLINNVNPKTGKPLIPSLNSLLLIAKGMGISLDELINNTDDIDVDISLTQKLPTVDNIIPMPKMNKIPLVGTIACGTPILATENIEDDVFTPENIRADFALRCKGDSMIDARINDGDIVYIREQPMVENGEIAAVLIDGEATLKRLFYENGVLTLLPCNNKYRPFVYSGAALEEIRVLGKAVGFTSTDL